MTGGLTAAAAVAAAEELFFLPQTFGHMEAGALGNAAPFRELTYGSYALGRAGGFSGAGLLGSIYQGVEPPEWMARLGLGPTEALGMLRRFGIVQRGVGENVDLAGAIGGMRFTPSFSGLDMEGSVGQAARYGLVSGNAGGIAQYTAQLAPILTMAVEQGLDRASVLRSIDASVAASMRGGGIGASLGGIGRFVSGFSMVPGGRTGEFGATVLQNLTSAAQQTGSDTQRTLQFSMLASRLNTREKLKAFLDQGGNAGAYDAYVANPVGAKQLDYYFQLVNSGQYQFAASYLRDIVSSGAFPNALSAALTTDNPILQQLPENLRPLAPGGSGLPSSQQFISNQMRARQTRGDAANNPLNLMSGPGGTLGVYSSMSAGIAADVTQIRRDIMVHDTRTLGSLIARWAPAAGGNDPVGYAKRVAARLGIGVNDTLNPDDPALMSRLVQAMAPEEVGHALSPTDVSSGVGRALGVTIDTFPGEPSASLPGYDRSVMDAGNIPRDALAAQAAALAGTMKGSEISFGEMNTVIPLVNKNLSDLATSAAVAAKTLRNMQQPTFGNPWLMTPP